MRFSSELQCATLSISYDRKMEKNSNYWGVFCALLTGLFKAFNCILHGLIITKWEIYGF